jgi:hypothetical protein
MKWSDGLPEYVVRSIEERDFENARKRAIDGMARATKDMTEEQSDEFFRRLPTVVRATLLPENCRLSPQSRSLFNFLVSKNGPASFLEIAAALWPRHFENKRWAELDPRLPEYHTLCDRIHKAQTRLNEQLLKGEAHYTTRFSARDEVVRLETL